MKNMMLPAKSCSIILCSLLLLAAGCKPKEEPVDPQKALYGNVARPEWVAPEDYDYTSSMTAVIRVDLKEQYPDAAKDFELKDDDLLAAFIGDECRGIATYDSGLFYLYIAGPGETVTLRYWSAQYTNLFAAEPISFVNDVQLGSTADPYKPHFVVAKE